MAGMYDFDFWERCGLDERREIFDMTNVLKTLQYLLRHHLRFLRRRALHVNMLGITGKILMGLLYLGEVDNLQEEAEFVSGESPQFYVLPLLHRKLLQSNCLEVSLVGHPVG